MKKIALLDGGMGQELIARSAQPPHPLWSAKVMMDEPEIVRAVHVDYLMAGARILTLNNYSATPERLARAGMGDMFKAVQKAAVDAGRAAIDQSEIDASIAGCLPPLVGSYRPDQSPSYERAFETYRRIVTVQVDHVDLLLCETLSSVDEVRAASAAAAESGKPVWVAMSLKDGADSQLRSGEPLSEGVSAAIDNGATAVLVNCSWPETISESLSNLAAGGKPFGAYANGFTSVDALEPGGTVDALKARDDLDPTRYADWSLECIGTGATIIGGCCEVGPAHIREIADRLNVGGFEIVGALHA